MPQKIRIQQEKFWQYICELPYICHISHTLIHMENNEADTGWWQPQRYHVEGDDTNAAIDSMSYRQLYSLVLWERILGRTFMQKRCLPS